MQKVEGFERGEERTRRGERYWNSKSFEFRTSPGPVNFVILHVVTRQLLGNTVNETYWITGENTEVRLSGHQLLPSFSP